MELRAKREGLSAFGLCSLLHVISLLTSDLWIFLPWRSSFG